MSRADLAKSNFMKGYNCSQAVLLAFADLAHLDEETALKISSSFGGGMGRMREVCGTVCGIFMAAGMIFYDAGAPAAKEKSNQYAIVQELARRFKEKNGSIICRELLSGVHTDSTPVAEARTEGYYKKRPCADLCYDAAEILEDYLRERGVIGE